MRKQVRLWLAVLSCAAVGWAVNWKALRPEGAVNDFAGVIDAGSKSQLAGYCAEVRRATGVGILLVTLPSLENEPVDGVAKAIFEAWRDAAAGPDKRVLLLLSVADRRSYVAAGGGLAGGMVSGLAARILREISPALRRGDYNEAFRAAAETVGEAAARDSRATISRRLPRRHRWSVWAAIPWAALAAGMVLLGFLIWAGTPGGYGLSRRHTLLSGLFRRPAMCRSTWGSRGSGGFGGYDSGDDFGGFGGGSCNDW